MDTRPAKVGPRLLRWLGGLTPVAITLGSPFPGLPAVPEEKAVPVSGLTSPDGRTRMELRLSAAGAPAFSVVRNRLTLLRDAPLGVALEEGGPLAEGLRVGRTARQSRDRTEALFPGKTSSLRDRFHELAVEFEEAGGFRRRLEIVFRAYNDGIAFRYRFPRQAALTRLTITEERTGLSFPGNPRAYALPLRNFTSSYEGYYIVAPLTELPKETLFGLPLLLHHPDGVWMAITEAGLTDYAGLYLTTDPQAPGSLLSRLSPLPGRPAVKVEAELPHASPWRALVIAEHPGRLIESTLVLSLNAPSALPETGWIRPGKTTFPWWNGYEVGDAGFPGAQDTRTHRHYLDFCAENGIPYHSLDGFDNVAWYGGPIVPYRGADITKSLPSIDLPELLAYARKKGVRLRLWMHWQAAQAHMERAFPLYEKWGIEGVMIDFMDRDDQEMVRFLHRLIRKAAEHRLTVTLHGVSKPTGIQRTYPNLLSFEGVLNLEYNKWDARGSTPEHELMIPFTRMLAGPMDYHLGSFRSVPPAAFKPRNIAPQVIGTPARMLAMYVVYENPLPMVADYPAAYRDQPGLPFLAAIPTVWDETRVLKASVGELLSIARRRGREWWIGTLTDASARELTLPLGFLGRGEYRAEILSDTPAEGGGTPDLRKSEQRVAAGQRLAIRLAPAGGNLIRLQPR